MSDVAPLRLAEDGQSSSASQSTEGHGSRKDRPMKPKMSRQNHNSRIHNQARNQESTSRNRNHGPSNNHDDQDEGGDYSERIESQDGMTPSASGHLRYGARNVIELFIPVSLCMIIVVGTMKATDSYKYSSQTVFWYAQVMFTDQSVDTGTRVWQSIANALIMLMLIVIMTTILILLYKFRWYKIIHGWLILSSLILLFMFAIMYIAEILKVYNLPIDIYTVMIFIWNFGVVGMICIHWKGPLLLQQAYLITISALLALVFIKSLPDWTTWSVSGIISIWDLVAVLSPRGPLRILVETAQERNEPIFPALIYSSTMIWEVVTTVVVVTTPYLVTMADSERNSKSKPDKTRNSRKTERYNSQPSSSSSSSSNNRRVMAANQKQIPQKREQHPVEIQYEGGARPPEIEVIQPTLSGVSDNWSTGGPVVTTLDASGPIDARDSRNHQTYSSEQNVTTQHVSRISESPEEQPGQQIIEEERGVKLGLGDFIFFSLLVGKVSSYNDWVITISCYVAILVGLCLTLSLLAIFRKALPALPISIAFGMFSFCMSYWFAAPFAEKLAINQVFV